MVLGTYIIFSSGNLSTANTIREREFGNFNTYLVSLL